MDEELGGVVFLGFLGCLEVLDFVVGGSLGGFTASLT